MASYYRPFSHAEFQSWMEAIEFKPVDVPGALEYAYQRDILCKRVADRLDRFKVRIMSSVDMRTGMSRDVGGDAIRVLLLDTHLQTQNGSTRIVADWTVNRTVGARENTIQRARDVWGYVSEHPEHHCSCGALMAVRKGRNGKFLGCTAFPTCTKTKPIEDGL